MPWLCGASPSFGGRAPCASASPSPTLRSRTSTSTDVMHGATFPPYEWQRFITHPFSDFFSLPWEEFVLEHNRHHASTVDLLIQGEFGWDPEEFHYMLQQWTTKWYGLIFTVPFIPI